ncbi:uncharacterized protein LOC116011910 isoform X2 [Ipomoea triloba]|uniref:uncharacterized protein LOC116011910 isoform X2 n=1 Tax=Ipomoea triloba TaxID=35885 RepID=UPI00125D7013|nr:uncharacterized protein LOC116011910 isoform X2 [Ipomoea triloba]
MTDELRNLEFTLPKVKESKKAKFSLGLAEQKLGSHIFEETKIPCQSNEFVLELLLDIAFVKKLVLMAVTLLGFFVVINLKTAEALQSKQLEELTGRMRECKRLIKEFDREIKDEESKNPPELNKQLNDEKQSMAIIYGPMVCRWILLPLISQRSCCLD